MKNLKNLTAALLFLLGMIPIAAQTSSDRGDGTFSNPVIYADAPDPSVIRVGNVFYMVSTTMHLSPGCTIMKSYDLVNWEVVNYAHDQLDTGDNFALKNGRNDYAAGSWAANLRYDKYEQRYYVIVTCNTTGKSYIFSTADIENGPWHRSVVDKCYDPGFLFEDTGSECKKYIVYPSDDLGRHESYIRSFTVNQNHDVTLGEPRIIIDYANIENPAQGLRAEGYHGYKIGEYYYVFMIQGAGAQRQEIVWRSKTLTHGSFEVKRIFGGNIVDSNRRDVIPFTGIAQGGIVDTEDGKWYAFLFQDYGAVGRIPVLIPMVWENGWPLLGNNGTSVNQIIEKPVQGYAKKSIIVPDEFNNGAERRIISDTDAGTGITAGISCEQLIAHQQEGTLNAAVEANEYGYNGSNLNVAWQWNHNPNNNLWSLTEREGYLRLKSGILASHIQQARNTLTQRTFGPISSANTAIEAEHMNDGDVAGLSAFQNQYGFVGVKMENGNRYIVMRRAQHKGDFQGKEMSCIPLNQSRVYLRVDCNFLAKTDKAYFYYSLDGTSWIRIGDYLQMAYDWPHFVGQRFGLFYYSTETVGGCVDVDYFHVGADLSGMHYH
jgi:arabinoxylan arabinofuranohydrolase